MESAKIEYRSVIKFLLKEGCNATVIHKRLVAVYGESAPNYSTVTRWFNEFKRGRRSVEDDPRSGRPSDAVNPTSIAAVEKIILQNRRVKVSEIAKELEISVGSVENIIHEHLHMSKVSARWVPRNLSVQDRHQRVVSSNELLSLYKSDKEKFCRRLVTGDETWIHHWDPESKLESMQWKHVDSPPPVKFRTQSSAGKVMATIFWDYDGLLMIDYLPPKKTITGQYYAELILKLREAIKQKRRGKLSLGVWLLHDNAPVHKSMVAQQALRDCGFVQLNHPAYSPDLAPSDYYLFRNLKSHLRGHRFADDESLKANVEAWFEGQDKDFYYQGINSLAEKWQKCIDVAGDYIEKI